MASYFVSLSMHPWSWAASAGNDTSEEWRREAANGGPFDGDRFLPACMANIHHLHGISSQIRPVFTGFAARRQSQPGAVSGLME